MERGLVWYGCWLKVHIRKKTYWLQLAGMVILVFLISSIAIPNESNVTVGIYNEGSHRGRQLTEILVREENVFDFIGYDDSEQMYEDVSAGRLECGFLLKNELDEQMEEGDLEESVIYVGTPLSAKGEVVQEIVYAALLQIYSDEILKRSEADIYGNHNKERMEETIERSREYRESDSVFQMNIRNVDIGNTKKQNGVVDGAVYPIQGTIGLFIFLIMFLAYGRRFDDKGCAVEKAMNKWDCFIFGCMNHLAAGTLPAITGIILTGIMGSARGITAEILRMLLFILWSSVWIMLVGNTIKQLTTFVAGIITIIITNALVCPVFIDLSAYIPALKYIRLIFPLGIYL